MLRITSLTSPVLESPLYYFHRVDPVIILTNGSKIRISLGRTAIIKKEYFEIEYWPNLWFTKLVFNEHPENVNLFVRLPVVLKKNEETSC